MKQTLRLRKPTGIIEDLFFNVMAMKTQHIKRK